MDTPKIINDIYKRWLKNPQLILSESDLKCQIYSEVIKNNATAIRTEWQCRRVRTDMIIYDPKEVIGNSDYLWSEEIEVGGTERRSAVLKKYEAVIELKFFYYPGYHKFKLTGLKEDVKKLEHYENKSKKRYLVCFDTFNNKHPKLPDARLKKLASDGIELIYKSRSVK